MRDALDNVLDDLSPAPVQDAPEWERFPDDSGSLNIPRAAMPQIKSEHRGAMVQFLKGRGISHTQEEVAPNTLKPSQAEFSPQKVERARGFEGSSRPLLVSADDHVIDGHHQWLSSHTGAPDVPIPVIRFNAPAHQLLLEAARFPSSGVDAASTTAPLEHTPRARAAAAPEPDELDGLLEEMKRPAPPHTAQAPSSDWRTLSEFAEGQGFTVTSTTRGRHNSGSAHYAGRAVDVRTRDKTPEQIAALDEAARAAGFVARDERTRPPGQSEWHGAHYHLETGAAPAGDDLDALLDTVPVVAAAAPGDELDQLLDSVPAHADEDAPDEIVTTSAPRDTGAPQTSHQLPTLPMSATPDLQTMEGRAQRDELNAQGSNPDARIKFDVHLPRGAEDWSKVSSADASRAAVRQYGAAHDVPAYFVEKWLGEHGGQNHLFDESAKTVEPVDLIYTDSPHWDAEKQTLRVSQELPQLKALRDDYTASLSPLDRAGEFMFDGQRSPGEKLLDVAAPVAGATAHGVGAVLRPFGAVPDAYSHSKLSQGDFHNVGADPLTAYAMQQALMGEEVPDYAKNFLEEAARHSDTLANINPHLPALVGAVTGAVTSPSNLLGLGVGKAGMQALKSSRLGAGVAAGLSEAMGGESKLAEFFSRGGRILDIEAAPLERAAAGGGATAPDALLVTIKDHEGNLHRVNTATGEIEENIKTLPRVMGMSVPDALEKYPKLDRHVAERLANAHERAAGFEAEAARADLPDDYRQTHAEQAARAHDEAAYLRDVQAAIAEHRTAGPTQNVLGDKPVEMGPGKTSGPGEAAPVAELPHSIARQMRALKEGRRGAVLVTPGSPMPPLPDGLTATETARGTFIHDARVVSPDGIRAIAEADAHHSLLGHVAPKTEESMALVVARDAQGREIQSSYASPENVEAQTEALRRQYPEATIETGGHELEQRVHAERAGGAPAKGKPSLTRRVAREFVNAYHLPKSFQASADLSATMRQGLIPLAAHPSFIPDVMKNQVKAFASQEAADALKDAILEHPDFNLMKESGLYLSSVRGSAPEEMFSSSWSEHIPVVKQSDRAYSAALDTVRVKSFEMYAAELKAAGVTDEKSYADIAHWINRATGRGEGKIVDALAPILNVPLFSPRLTASRFQVLNPVFYMRMTPAARRIAVREMMRSTGTISATVGLAALAGAHTSLDPRNANFGKIVAGNTHLDVGAGELQAVRYVAQMTDAFAREAKGEKVDDKLKPTAITARFLRSKLGPLPSYAVDVATGKDYSGDTVEWKRRALQMAVPFVVSDLREGWQDSGAWGALKASPAILGVGVSTYKEKPQRGGRFGRGRSHSYTNSEPQELNSPANRP